MSLCWRALVPPPSRTIRVSPSLPKYNRYPGPTVDTVLQHPAADTSHIREVASLHAGQGGPDPGRRPRVENVKPATEGVSAAIINVFSDKRIL